MTMRDGSSRFTTLASPERPSRAVQTLEPRVLPASTGSRWRLLAPELLVAGVALLVFTWRITTPSPWWDEAVSRYVVTLSTHDILQLTRSVDLVHLFYYLIGHTLYFFLGEPRGSEHVYLILRTVSALSATATAVYLVRLGRAFGSLQVGCATAAFLVASPLASRYAQEARPYALVTLAAVLSTLALLRAMMPAPNNGRLWGVYLGSLVAMGLLNNMSLLLIPVHLAFFGIFGDRALLRRCLAATAGAAVLLFPFLVASSRQRGQVSWLEAPSRHDLTRFYGLLWESSWIPVLVVLFGVVLWVRRTPAAERFRSGGGSGEGADGGSGAGGRPLPRVAVLTLGLLWAFFPPVFLWTLSQAHPFFIPRYLIFIVPGAALVLGSLVFLTSRVVTAALVVVLVFTGFHTQVVYRNPIRGHAENIRAVALMVKRESRDGDAVVFLTSDRRIVERGYPDYFADLDDIALNHAADQEDVLYGTEITDTGLFDRRLLSHSRVWVISGEARSGDTLSALDREKQRMISRNYLPIESLSTGRYIAALYVARPLVGRTPKNVPLSGNGLPFTGIVDCAFCP